MRLTGLVVAMNQQTRAQVATNLSHGTEAIPWRIGGEAVRGLVPALNYANHKGQAGRIGVLGGSLEYTGAPYYAAASTLQLGADLSWVFTATDAATPIKGGWLSFLYLSRPRLQVTVQSSL